jgi:cellulose synthase/poly-beta-1,6-N-acetylglucosamine synthase-like glycosyltransferase
MVAVAVVFLLVGAYPYLIYPALICLAARFRRRSINKRTIEPSVTVVIAAYNEVNNIRSTITNKLKQDYPQELLDVMVVSDASTDGTNAVVQELADESSRVELLVQDTRSGKTSALNRAVERVKSDIVVFSDANSSYEESAIRKLVANFSDAGIGYVSGSLRAPALSGSPSGGLINFQGWYEDFVRECETAVGSVVGVDGGIDAVRRELYRPMRPDQLPDFVLPLMVVTDGYRVVYEPQAISYELPLLSAGSELKMRTRVTTRAMWALLDNTHLLNPRVYGIFSWQLLSHKWMRYLSAFPLLVAYLLSVVAAHESGVTLTIAGSGTCILVVSLATFLSGRLFEQSIIARLCANFVILNISQLLAVIRIAHGDRFTTWQPRLG